MKLPVLAQNAAKILAREDLGEHPVSNERRAETVDAIRAELVARARRRARRRWLGPAVVASAAAALLVASAAVWSSREPTSGVAVRGAPHDTIAAESVRGWVYVIRGGVREPLETRAALASGESIAVADGEAVFALGSGTKLDVERGTDLAILSESETESVRLDHGIVTSRVTKLHGAQRFIVHTPDADVEVRGTVFRVSRLAEGVCGERTRVQVREGRVEVRHAKDVVVLDPGAEWASPCNTPTPAPASSRVVDDEKAIAAAPSPSGRRPPTAAPKLAAPNSELAAQNALFAEAMTAKAHGDPKRAVSFLDVLLEKYPRAPLREGAEAQRMTLLEGVDPPRAASLAREYLERYPRGFARADATRIANGAR